MSEVNEIKNKITLENDASSNEKAGEQAGDSFSKGFQKGTKNTSRVFDDLLAKAKAKGGRWWETIDDSQKPKSKNPVNLKKYVEALKLTPAQMTIAKSNLKDLSKSQQPLRSIYRDQLAEYKKYQAIIDSNEREKTKSNRKKKNREAYFADLDSRREAKKAREAEEKAQKEVEKVEKKKADERAKAEAEKQKLHDKGIAGRVFYATDISQRGGSVYSKDILSHMGDYYRSLEQMSEREANLAYGRYQKISREDIPQGEEASLILAGLTRVNGKTYEGSGSERFKDVMARIQTTGADTIFGKFKEKFDSATSSLERFKNNIKRLNAISFKSYGARPLNFKEGTYAAAHGLARGAGKVGRGAFGIGKKTASGLWKFNKSLFSKYSDKSRFGQLDAFFGNRKAETNLEHFVKNATPLSKVFSRATNAVKRFGGQFARAFRMKVIRQLVSRAIALIKDGFKNLNEYSKHMGTPFHKNVMELATSLLYLKNAFAAMAAPLVNALYPALRKVMDGLAELANQVGAFFAAITGQNQFSAALRKTVTETQSAAGKLKDILAFDELNRLSGDTGAGNDADEMFEEWDQGTIFQTMKELIDNAQWELLGDTLADKINGIIGKIKEKDLGKELGKKLGGCITFARRFLEKMDFVSMGETLATFINNAISGIDWNDVGALMARSFTLALDFFRGLISTLNWGQIGTALHDMLVGLFSGFSKWLKDINWHQMGLDLVQALVDFITNLDILDVLGAFVELGASLLKGIANMIGGIVQGLLELIFGDLPNWLVRLLGGDTTKLDLKANVEESVKAEFDGKSYSILERISKFLEKVFPSDGSGSAAYEGPEPGITGEGYYSILNEAEQEALWGPFKWLYTATKWNNELNQQELNALNGIEALNESIKSSSANTNAYALLMYRWGCWLGPGDTISIEGVAAGGLRGVAGRAAGGTVDKGQLFIANEAGPELIGNLNGKTSVTNYDQFTQSVIDANSIVVDAVMQVVSAINNKDLDVYMDSQKVGQSVTQYQNSMARRFGY